MESTAAPRAPIFSSSSSWSAARPSARPRRTASEPVTEARRPTSTTVRTSSMTAPRHARVVVLGLGHQAALALDHAPRARPRSLSTMASARALGRPRLSARARNEARTAEVDLLLHQRVGDRAHAAAGHERHRRRGAERALRAHVDALAGQRQEHAGRERPVVDPGHRVHALPGSVVELAGELPHQLHLAAGRVELDDQRRLALAGGADRARQERAGADVERALDARPHGALGLRPRSRRSRREAGRPQAGPRPPRTRGGRVRAAWAAVYSPARREFYLSRRAGSSRSLRSDPRQ